MILLRRLLNILNEVSTTSSTKMIFYQQKRFLDLGAFCSGNPTWHWQTPLSIWPSVLCLIWFYGQIKLYLFCFIFHRILYNFYICIGDILLEDSLKEEFCFTKFRHFIVNKTVSTDGILSFLNHSVNYVMVKICYVEFCMRACFLLIIPSI